ncbi:MAG: type II toxin-antitoxin system Phd/YefM family antitoxin [Acidobacteria bacterium]|nr:type II toxin-antitoxin system Phd/YefM family antitoxin [Acidobacteriota bacterium]
MKQTTLAASEFKAKCLRLLDRVEEEGDTLVITKRGRPVAKVVPVSSPRRSLRGSWKGLVQIKGDIVHFDTSRDWESSR